MIAIIEPLLLLLVVMIAVTFGLVLRARRRRNVRAATASAGTRDTATAAPVAAVHPDTAVAVELTEHALWLALYAPAFEAPTAAAAADGARAELARTLGTRLSGLERDLRYVPRRPHLLPQLLNAVNDDEASGRRIAAIIAQDPALAGNLLRVANSAFYRVRPQPIETIERAVAIVGTDGLRRLIAAAVLQPVLDGGPGIFGQLPAIVWDHALASAVATVALARQVERIDAFAAQMLALLHGLGAIAVVRATRDACGADAAQVPDVTLMTTLLARWAPSVARRIARDWELADELALALADQRLDLAAADLRPAARSLRIGRVAAAAVILYRRGAVRADSACDLLQRMGLPAVAVATLWDRLAAPHAADRSASPSAVAGAHD